MSTPLLSLKMKTWPYCPSCLDVARIFTAICMSSPSYSICLKCSLSFLPYILLLLIVGYSLISVAILWWTHEPSRDSTVALGYRVASRILRARLHPKFMILWFRCTFWKLQQHFSKPSQADAPFWKPQSRKDEWSICRNIYWARILVSAKNGLVVLSRNW